MIKFRWHRGILEDSMATAMEFDGLSKLFDYLCKSYITPLKKQEIEIIYYGLDKRIKQELFVVYVKGYVPIGFIFEEV